MKTSVQPFAGTRMFFSIVFATMLAGFVSAFQAQTIATATATTTVTAVTTATTAAFAGDVAVVELPKLEVRGERILPQPEKFWNYSRYQNIEVLSDMTTGRTRNFIRYFGEYLNVINTIFPQTKLNTMLPLKIILCGRESTFRQFGNQRSNSMVVYRNFEQIVFVIYTNYDPFPHREDKIKVITLPDDWDYKTGLLVSEPDAEQNYEAMDARANATMNGISPYRSIAVLLMPSIALNTPVLGLPTNKSNVSTGKPQQPVVAGTGTTNAGTGANASAGAGATIVTSATSTTGATFRYTLKTNNEIAMPYDIGSYSGASSFYFSRSPGFAGPRFGGGGWAGRGMGGGYGGFSGYPTSPGFVNYSGSVSFDSTDYALRLLQDRIASFYFETFRGRGMPAWYESALRQIWRDVDIWNKNVFVAKNVAGIIAMSNHTPLPMEQIFEDGRTASGGASSPGGSRATTRMSGWRNPWNWNSQCYAFVHYCLYKHRTKLQQGFVKFLDAACRGPVDEAFFKECFNMSYKQMENALSAYSNYVDYDTPWYKFIDDPWPKNVVVRSATEAEVGRIKGETLAMAGNKFAAQQELIAPYIRKNTDAELLGALGLHLLANDNPEKARKLLEAAFDGGDNRARVCIALSNLRMASALVEEKKLHGDDAKLTAGEVNAALRPLSVALEQKPVLSAAYLLLADIWQNSAAAPTAEQFNKLVAGVRVFPYNMELIYRITNLMADTGRAKEAAAVAEQGLRLSRTPQDKRRFAALQARLDGTPR